MKIANKISLSFLVTAVVLTGLAAPVFYIVARKSLEDRIYAHLETTAQSRAHHIETYLEEHKIIVEILASDILLKNTLIEIIGIEKDSDSHTGYENIASVEVATTELQEALKTDSHFNEICIVNLDGKVVISTDESNLGLDKSACECFLNGKKRLFVEDAHLCGTRKEGVISVSAPMLCGEAKETLGVIIAKIDLEGLYGITTENFGDLALITSSP